MIDHKHKCIFIHIPRCGGTSIEIAMYGKNWFYVESSTKHLIASTAKNIYKPYWNDYFKFSFVRNPWDRMVSLAKYPTVYKLNLNKGKLVGFEEYFKEFPEIEVDKRSKSLNDTFYPIKNSVYLNILNVELDFIGRFENLNEDFEFIYKSIGDIPPLLTNDLTHRSCHEYYTEYYDDETREIVAQKYARDIEYFGYKFGD